ncbi:HDOD domain protein [Botrimarina colliarenosi]|uniref:HDOD domain protein n=1 Tax=Botrimarina colliarenosi TaxID=2528001 RepID=A0A5C6AC71_9BACT|nr:HDOD domain-containing protein [Botrimarina colliarenosi]TWT95853.1 HDOD domain protein [Botrimarina colliarenosi]
MQVSFNDGDRAIDPSIEPMFEKLAGLCTLPTVAQKVIQIADDSASDATDLLVVIEQDPAVSARLMQVVNSAYCGLRNPVGDLKTALTLLGVERVRNLALTLSIGAVLGRHDTSGRLDPTRLWDHAVCVGTVSRMIAKRSDACHPEEAYLAGLLHDIGLLFINQHLGSLVPRVLALLKSGVALPTAEHRVLGFDHAQLGAYVAWRGHFPPSLVHTIDYHHNPAACPEADATQTRIVAVANYLATRYGRGSVADRRLPAPPEGVLAPLGLNLNALRHLWAELPDAVANVNELTSS